MTQIHTHTTQSPGATRNRPGMDEKTNLGEDVCLRWGWQKVSSEESVTHQRPRDHVHILTLARQVLDELLKARPVVPAQA